MRHKRLVERRRLRYTNGMAKQATTKKTTSKRATGTRSRSKKVDYYPNRMTFAVAAAAATSLVLLGMLTVTLW